MLHSLLSQALAGKWPNAVLREGFLEKRGAVCVRGIAAVKGLNPGNSQLPPGLGSSSSAPELLVPLHYTGNVALEGLEGPFQPNWAFSRR